MSGQLSCTGQPSPPCPLVHRVIVFARYLGGGRDADAPAIDGALALGRSRAGLAAHFSTEQEDEWARHQPPGPQGFHGNYCPQEQRHEPQQRYRHGLQECDQVHQGFRRIVHVPPIAQPHPRTKTNARPAATRASAGGAGNRRERIEP